MKQAKRWFRVLAAVLFVVLSSAPAVAPVAYAQATGTVSGTVPAFGSGHMVAIYDTDGGYVTTVAASNGQWSATLPMGTYQAYMYFTMPPPPALVGTYISREDQENNFDWETYWKLAANDWEIFTPLFKAPDLSKPAELSDYTVRQGNLILYKANDYSVNSRLHRVTHDWSRTGNTWQKSAASSWWWWDSPGADGVYDMSASYIERWLSQDYGSIGIDVTGDVRYWLDQGNPNYGWVWHVDCPNGCRTFLWFASEEHSTPAYRPLLDLYLEKAGVDGDYHFGAPQYSEVKQFSARAGENTVVDFTADDCAARHTAPGVPLINHVPETPLNPWVEALGNDEVKLHWTDSSADESDFHIERARATEDWSEIGTVAANSTYFIDSQVACGTSYRLRAHRHSIDVYSARTDMVTYVTNACTFLRGTITTHDGTPVAGIEAHLWGNDDSPSHHTVGLWTVMTNAEGQWTMAVSEDQWNTPPAQPPYPWSLLYLTLNTEPAGYTCDYGEGPAEWDGYARGCFRSTGWYPGLGTTHSFRYTVVPRYMTTFTGRVTRQATGAGVGGLNVAYTSYGKIGWSSYATTNAEGYYELSVDSDVWLSESWPDAWNIPVIEFYVRTYNTPWGILDASVPPPGWTTDGHRIRYDWDPHPGENFAFPDNNFVVQLLQ